MKKKMKHLIAVMMCLVLSISVLSGCGSSSESTGSKEKADSLNIMAVSYTHLTLPTIA